MKSLRQQQGFKTNIKNMFPTLSKLDQKTLSIFGHFVSLSKQEQKNVLDNLIQHYQKHGGKHE